MTSVNAAAPVKGEEHWTNKGADVKLSLWNKRVVDQSATAGTILFVHGSSMAARPVFDLDVPDRKDSSGMDWFARQGFLVLRFWNSDVLGNLEPVLQRILDAALERLPPP